MSRIDVLVAAGYSLGDAARIVADIEAAASNGVFWATVEAVDAVLDRCKRPRELTVRERAELSERVAREDL